MPHSFGLRARTRHMLKRDIKANAAQQKGMPHKYYHGRTGIVYNVTPSPVGVIVYKVVGNRYLEKRVNLLNRVKSNAEKKKEAKAKGEHVQLKRLPVAPRESRTVSTQDNTPQTLAPIPYDTTI